MIDQIMEKNTIVLKRDNTRTIFNDDKIFQAILSTFIELNYLKEGFDNTEILEEISDLTTEVSDKIKDDEYDEISVDEIQDIVFDTLLNSDYKDVAKSYIQYAERKNISREKLQEFSKNSENIKININTSDNTPKVNISKKNGRIENYNEEKLKTAINLAAPEKVSKGLMSKLVFNINKKVNKYIDNLLKENNTTGENIVTTDQLHDFVEEVLTEEAPEIYDQYAIYRRYKKNMSKSYNAARKDTEKILYDGDKENANRDSQLNSTKQTLTAESFMKRLMRDFELSPEVRKAHDEGWIYIHDIGARYLRQINCVLFDMGNVLKDGFTMNGAKYLEPKSFASAIAVMGDVTLQASGQQYGGFTVPEVDTVLAPYAEKSYKKHLEEFEDLDIEIEKIKEIALKTTIREIEQGIQGYSMKLNTISSSLGQIPFNTITFGLNTSFWGREITKAILRDRLNGIGEDKITAVFPKLVMLMREEINRSEDSPNYDLFELAIKCSQKRLYPDYLSLDGAENGNNLAEVYERSGRAVSPMGCTIGTEPIQWNEGVTSIERMWNKLSKQFPVKTQPDGVNKFIDLENVKIADSHTGKQEMVECKRIIKNKATDWLEVRISNGRNITCTPDHPFHIEGVGRVLAKDLQLGMEVLPVTVKLANPSKNINQEKIDKAWLLGLILCDGCLHEPSEILVSYANTGEDEIRDKIGKIIPLDRLRDIQQSRGAKGTYKEVAIKNRELRDLCISLFDGMRKSERRLPKEIFEAPREERIAFLAGMIDADGYLNKANRTVQIGSTNPEIAYGQKVLAESLGYKAHVYINHYNKKDQSKIRWAISFKPDKKLVDKIVCQKKKDNYRESNTKNTPYLISSIEKVDGPEFSYDVTTETDYFDVSGIVSHNCRAYLSPYWNGGEEIYTGRGNTGAVSLNLPKIAIEANGNIDKFYEMIDTYAELIWDFHKSYIDKVGKQKGSTNPLFYCEGGAWKKIGYNEEISSVVEAFTSSLGYIGVDEAVKALTGKPLKEQHNLGIDIVQHLKNNVDKATKKYGFLAALYATPAESLCYTFQKMNKAQYGEIDGVTDREYITNSFHIPVWEEITVPEKISAEEGFHHISTGGRISYNEFPWGTPEEVLEEAINYAMDKGLYYGINIISSTCLNCKYEGDFQDACPKCGNTEDIVSVARVCGYLSFSRMKGDKEGRYNPGKKAEVLDRVKHFQNK